MENRTVTPEEQREHLKKIDKLASRMSKTDGRAFALFEEEIEIVQRALACHMAVITLDLKRQENGPDENNMIWIPCSKRNPEKEFQDMEFIVCASGHIENRHFEKAVLFGEYDGEKWYIDGVYQKDMRVLAWTKKPLEYLGEVDDADSDD